MVLLRWTVKYFCRMNEGAIAAKTSRNRIFVNESQSWHMALVCMVASLYKMCSMSVAFEDIVYSIFDGDETHRRVGWLKLSQLVIYFLFALMHISDSMHSSICLHLLHSIDVLLPFAYSIRGRILGTLNNASMMSRLRQDNYYAFWMHIYICLHQTGPLIKRIKYFLNLNRKTLSE